MRFIKYAIIILLAFSSEFIAAQTDSTRKKVTVSGNVQFTNNGIAPVPVFALGRPAVSGTAIIKKGNFYFNPEFNFGLDLKPWTINTKLGYIFLNRKKLTMSVVVNINFFFREIPPLANNETFELQRYTTEELNGEYRIKNNRSLQFQYWRSDRVDKVGIAFEDFVMVSYAMDQLPIGSSAFINFKPGVLYIHDQNAFEGLFVAQTSTFQLQSWKWNIFLQTIIPIKAVPASNFLWNTGVNIPF